MTHDMGVVKLNVNGITASEWLEQNRTKVRIEMMACELGAWRSPESVTRLYLCSNGKLFSIVKLYEGVDKFPESNTAICIAEFKHPGRNLLEESIVEGEKTRREVEDLFLHWATDEDQMLWNATPKPQNYDRMDVCHFFRTKTRAYARAKKTLELDEMNKVEWDKVIDNIIELLKGQNEDGRNE